MFLSFVPVILPLGIYRNKKKKLYLSENNKNSKSTNAEEEGRQEGEESM